MSNASDCTSDKYPGSTWVNGGCFIHNVPLDAYDDPVPRGSTDYDVMFTCEPQPRICITFQYWYWVFFGLGFDTFRV